MKLMRLGGCWALGLQWILFIGLRDRPSEMLVSLLSAGQDCHASCQQETHHRKKDSVTYLATFGTNNTSRTLRISKRRPMSSNCSSLVNSWCITRTHTAVSHPNCQVGGINAHSHFSDITRELKHPCCSCSALCSQQLRPQPMHFIP